MGERGMEERGMGKRGVTGETGGDKGIGEL